MAPINFSGNRNQRPKMPLIAAPASGNSGTSQMYLNISFEFRVSSFEFVMLACASFGTTRTTRNPKLETRNLFLPFHQINFIHPDRFPIAIERDHNPKSNRRFRGSHYNHEDGEYLTSQRIAAAGVL